MTYEYPPRPHGRLVCDRCGTVLVSCRCLHRPTEQLSIETVAGCNLCLLLTDYEAAQKKRTADQ